MWRKHIDSRHPYRLALRRVQRITFKFSKKKVPKSFPRWRIKYCGSCPSPYTFVVCTWKREKCPTVNVFLFHTLLGSNSLPRWSVCTLEQSYRDHYDTNNMPQTNNKWSVLPLSDICADFIVEHMQYWDQRATCRLMQPTDPDLSSNPFDALRKYTSKCNCMYCTSNSVVILMTCVFNVSWTATAAIDHLAKRMIDHFRSKGATGFGSQTNDGHTTDCERHLAMLMTPQLSTLNFKSARNIPTSTCLAVAAVRCPVKSYA